MSQIRITVEEVGQADLSLFSKMVELTSAKNHRRPKHQCHRVRSPKKSNSAEKDKIANETDVEPKQLKKQTICVYGGSRSHSGSARIHAPYGNGECIQGGHEHADRC